MMGALAGALALLLGLSAGGPRLVFQGDPSRSGFGSVILVGLSEEALRAIDSTGASMEFSVYVGVPPRPGEDRPSVLGRYSVEEDSIRFVPRLPFVPGLSYTARRPGDPAMGVPDLELRFTMPLPDGDGPTRVEAVYPSGNEVPANLIRIYVHFSAPMLPRDVHHHVHLVDEQTESEIPVAFVDVPSGLWDPDDRRLTLFIHPGRVKRGVAPGEEMGAVLVEGRRYRLVIDAGLRDSGGAPLAASYEKSFVAVSEDRRSPDPSRWNLSAPGRTGGPVVLEMPSPLDHGLMRRLITVRSESGRIVDGTVTISGNETRWELHPPDGWKPGRYAIVINPAIEDLAGNTIDRLFEREGAAPPEERLSPPIEIPFEVR